MSIFLRWTADEKLNFVKGELNKKFPEIKHLVVKKMIEKYWTNK